MTEGAPTREKMLKAEYVGLAIELSQRPEGFPFPSISRDAYAKIKTTEIQSPDEPGFGRSTPIDILVERLQRHGMKVSTVENQQTTLVYILPLDSNDVVADSLFPRQLEAHAGVDPDLAKLITANKAGVS